MVEFLLFVNSVCGHVMGLSLSFLMAAIVLLVVVYVSEEKLVEKYRDKVNFLRMSILRKCIVVSCVVYVLFGATSFSIEHFNEPTSKVVESVKNK